MQTDVLSIKGAKTGRTVELPDEIFGVEPNEHVVYLAVKQYLAAQRQGTHKVKTRAEVHRASAVHRSHPPRYQHAMASSEFDIVGPCKVLTRAARYSPYRRDCTAVQEFGN